LELLRSFRKSNTAFYLFCLIFGQLLLVLTSFYWEGDGRYSVTASTLMFFSMLFWAIGFIEFYNRLKPKLPLVSKMGLLYAFHGVFGGVVFA
jgi:hypothetical protein